MKPKIKTRIANLIAKLAGSDEYDPRVEPITPLEFYLDQYIKDPIPRLTLTLDMFNRNAPIPIDLTQGLYERILRTGMMRVALGDAHRPVIQEYILPCSIVPNPRTARNNISVTYLQISDPEDPDGGYVSFNFGIAAESDTQWSFMGAYKEI